MCIQKTQAFYSSMQNVLGLTTTYWIEMDNYFLRSVHMAPIFFSHINAAINLSCYQDILHTNLSLKNIVIPEVLCDNSNPRRISKKLFVFGFGLFY